MSGIKVTLFGKFSIERDSALIEQFRARKVQELFCYLLIFRNHPQSRELLSETLWEGQPAGISKKNLRQTLWRLQCALKANERPAPQELITEDEWIQYSPADDFWLDVAEFEKTFDLVKEKNGRELGQEDFETIQAAVELYKGDLLDGWYQDWCILERERFQSRYLMLLDKLVQYCEIHNNYDLGLVYGAEILRRDRAYERTHRQMMRLYCLAGDRTQALRQYERCASALQEELDVEPSERTKQLYEQIRADAFKPPAFVFDRQKTPVADKNNPDLNDALKRLENFSEMLVSIEFQVQREIFALANTISDRR